MTEAAEKSELQEAPVITHDEESSKAGNEVILKSSFDNLGLWPTVKRFWKVNRDPELSRICGIVGIFF